MDVGVVVIGRNEGERLRDCLGSINSTNTTVIYVDSGSTDDSLLIAREMHVDVVELDTKTPFSAARARNEGFEYLLKRQPNLQFIQFIDGDCTLAQGWLDKGRKILIEGKLYAAVVGHLQELNATASIYNQLCAMEWNSAVGDFDNYGALGGISMMRASVFKQLNGFNCNVIAGEDSELGVRMALAGYKVTKIDHAMAVHDANMHRFSQWWQRAVRGGHAIGQRASLNGKSAVRDCVKELNSVWFWGIGLPLFLLMMIIPTKGLSLVLFCGYLVLGFRVFRYRQNLGDTPSEAWVYALFTVLGKFAGAIGLIKFYLNQARKQYEIIEYK